MPVGGVLLWLTAGPPCHLRPVFPPVSAYRCVMSWCLQMQLKQLLQKQPDSLPLDAVLWEYKRQYHEQIDPRQFGYVDELELLQSAALRQTCYVEQRADGVRGPLCCSVVW